MPTPTLTSIKAAVHIYVREDGHGLKNVTVRLYDRDERSADDLLDTGTTDQNGRVRFDIPAAEALDHDDYSNGLRGYSGRFRGRSGLPDLFVELVNDEGTVVHSTRRRVQRDVSAARLSIPLSRSQAKAYGLLKDKPKPSPDKRRADWCDWWKKQQQRSTFSDPDVALCLTRTMLDTVAGLDNPSTRLQKETVSKLRDQVHPNHLRKVASLAAKGLKSMDDCDLQPTGLKCGSDRGDDAFEELVQHIFFAPDGEGANLLKSFSETAPDPEGNLGDPSAGIGFAGNSSFDKNCVARHENGDLGGQGRADMDAFYPSTKVLAPPSVNRVEVWDPDVQNTVRIGRMHDKELTVRDRDVQNGWTARTIPMDLDLNDPECLVLEDGGTGRQVMVVDVRPGQKIRLMGSGFVSDEAHVSVDLRDWRDQLTADGALVPGDDVLPVPGFDDTTVEVHGHGSVPLPGDEPDTFNKDEIVFAWPDAAERVGLYRVVLTFQNESDYYTEIVQDPDDCTIKPNKDDVHTVPLYFAMLPAVEKRRMRMVATDVHCDDETDPESVGPVNLPDDVLYVASGERMTFRFNGTTGEPEDEIHPLITAEASRLFWDAPDSWSPNLELFPGPDADSLFLDLEDIIVVMATAFEVEGDLDRAILNAVLLIVLVAVVVTIILIILGTIIALIAAGVLTVGTGGTAAPTIAIVAAIGTFLTGTAFTAGLAAIAMIVSSIGGQAPIAQAMTLFTGQEIAHRLSPIRFHRLLWAHERPNEGASVTNSTRVEAGLVDGDFREVYEASAQGGRYRLALVAQSI